MRHYIQDTSRHRNREGVQQGDPEGQPLFIDALTEIVEGVTSEMNEWYLDDGNIADEADVILNDFPRLIVGFANMGLQTNYSKCELVFLDNQEEHNRAKILKKFRQICTPIETTEIEDLVILGSPLGKRSLEKTLTEKKEDLERLSLNLKKLENHHALSLLKSAFSIRKLLFILRTSPCFKQPVLLKKYDEILRLSLESISNVKIVDTSWEQATLPVKYDGIGLSSAVQLAPSAFLAPAAGSEKLISEILPEDTHLDDELLFSAIEHWHALSDADLTVVIKEPAAQKDWSAAVNKQKFARIQLVNANNETPRARVLAYQGKIAGAWLNAYP